GNLIGACRSGMQPASADFQYAVEQALRHRRPAAVLIDEAQHLAKVPSGRRLADQLDVIKSIASHTGTVHVLFGTYDLLAFRNLTHEALDGCALSVSQCDRMAAEILEGEREMTERREQVCSLRARLGLENRRSEESPSMPVSPPATEARAAKRSPRPGKRRPV